MISGLRHRLVHDYEGTNWQMIVEVVFEDIPALLVQLEKLVSKEQAFMKIINFYGGAGIYKTTIVQKQIEIKLMPPVVKSAGGFLLFIYGIIVV